MLKKLALMVIAHKSTSKEIGILRKIFEKYDTERNGKLTYDEFVAVMKEVGVSVDGSSAVFDALVSKLLGGRSHMHDKAVSIDSPAEGVFVIQKPGPRWQWIYSLYGIYCKCTRVFGPNR